MSVGFMYQDGNFNRVTGYQACYTAWRPLGMENRRYTMHINFTFFMQSGNVGVDKTNGQPIIFDPASYYGHNEAE